MRTCVCANVASEREREREHVWGREKGCSGLVLLYLMGTLLSPFLSKLQSAVIQSLDRLILSKRSAEKILFFLNFN